MTSKNVEIVTRFIGRA